MSSAQYNARSANVIINNHVESSLLLPRRLEIMINKKNRKTVFLYFCVGFILNAVIALIAYGLTQGIFEILENLENNTDKPTTLSSTSDFPFTASTSTFLSPESCQRRIVAYERAYYPQAPTFEQMSKLTHFIMRTKVVLTNGKLVFKSQSEKNNFGNIIRNVKSIVKTMFCTESEELNEKTFSTFAGDTEKRTKFILAISSFINEYGIDGIDIKLLRPTTNKEHSDTVLFFKELRETLSILAKLEGRNDPYIISIFCDSYDPIELSQIMKYVNFITMDVNNYYAPWHANFGELTGPPSPLYSGHGKSPKGDIDKTMKTYICEMRTPNKVNMRLDFHGRFWNNVIKPNNSSNTLWMTAERKNGSIDGGIVAWRDMKNEGWDVSSALWNDESRTPYIWNSEKRRYLGFDNERSLKEKIKYAIDKNLGGFTIAWLHGDDDEYTLLNVVASANLCSGEDNTAVKYNCD